MALVKKPDSNQLISDSNHLKAITPEAKAFITGAEETTAATKMKRKKVPVLLRVDSELLKEIDAAAAEDGLKRAAFFVSLAAKHIKKRKASH